LPAREQMTTGTDAGFLPSLMASGINFYSQLVISAIRISDISNLITDITNSK